MEQPVAVTMKRVAELPAPAATVPQPETQARPVAPPPLVRCAEEGWIAVPAAWGAFRELVVFAKHGTRKLEAIDPVEWQPLVELLRSRRDLVVLLEGSRFGKERLGLVRQRQEVVQSDLQSLGIAADQVWLARQRAYYDAAVSVRVVPRPVEPVALNEPCGTTIVDLPGSNLDKGLEAVGWWAREAEMFRGEFDFSGVRTRKGVQLQPLRGSRLTSLVRLVDGYVAPRWWSLTNVIEVVSTDLDGRRTRLQSVPVTPNAGVSGVGLAAHPDGVVLAWTERLHELYTVNLDHAGALMRPPSRELVVDGGIHELSLDWRLGAGGIAFSQVDPAAGYAADVYYVALGPDGHVRGAPTFVADAPWVSGSSAVATLAADRVAVLIGTCGPYTMRIDFDGAGKLLAIDRRFLRNPTVRGLGIGLRGDRLWAASLSTETADIRPFCEPPVGASSPASAGPQEASTGDPDSSLLLGLR